MQAAKKLSIAELKSRSAITKNVIANIEAIKGGADDEYCHEGNGKPTQQDLDQSPTYTLPQVHEAFDDFIRTHGLR